MGILEDGLDALGGLFKKEDGTTDYGNLISLGGALLGGTGVLGTNTPVTGYQGTVPKYDVQREVVPGTYDPNRRPGSGGQRYFTQTQYVPRSETPATPMSAEGLAALNVANPAREVVQQPVQQMAAGGIATLKKGQYLNGASDGMADKVPANIDGVQEARLSDGEFVIPADVVSHLGNGNSDAGAKVLKGHDVPRTKSAYGQRSTG